MPSGTKSPAWSLALLSHSCTCRKNTRRAAKPEALCVLLSTLPHRGGLSDEGLNAARKQADTHENTAHVYLGSAIAQSCIRKRQKQSTKRNGPSL